MYPAHPAEPYEEVISVLTSGFKLRRSDAISRSVRQLREWNEQITGMENRGQKASVKALTAFCDEISKLIKANVGKYTPRDGFGPTPEQDAKPARRDSIKSLEDAGRLSADQVAAAREIQRIVELVTGCCHPRGQSFERQTGGFSPGSLFSSEVACKWSENYLPWHRALRKRSDKRIQKLAMKVIVDGWNLDAARCNLRMSYERGHRYLTEALDLYSGIREQNSTRDRSTIRRQEGQTNA